MIFYEIIVKNLFSEKTDNEKIFDMSEKLYQDLEKNAFVAVCAVSENNCTLIATVEADYINKYTVEFLVNEFFEEYITAPEIKRFKEIPLRVFKRHLNRAEHSDYIEDSDKIIADLKLECDCNYGEYLAKDITKENIRDLTQTLLYERTFDAELDRIYCGNVKTEKLHHPVHYIVRSDNEDYYEIIDCLISALYENKRLFSKRYSEFEITSRMYDGVRDLKKLYSIQRGGTVVLKIDPSGNDESAYETGRVCEYIEKMTKAVNKYNQDVLTVFVMPQVCERETEAVYKNTDAVLVELTPENASGKRAQKYLEYKAKKAEIPFNNTLFNGISEDKAFTADELSEKFAFWYSDYVRTEMYPQYAEVKRKITSENENHFGQALKDLDEMIGLSNAKKVIYNALDYYKVQKLYKQLGKKLESPSMHMVFTGNPGTAKTTVARLFAQILKDNNIIKNGRLIEVGRADLVGKYVGHTAPLVKRAFEEAKGGVLFIDEAYSLVDDKSGMFGDEAINTIVQEMENRRNETIVIFAGYPNEMERFLARNPGLRSRIAFNVPFEDYSADELVEITKLLAKNKGNIIDTEAIKKLSGIYRNVVGTSDFGNGRYARNILEKAELNRASRIAKMNFDEVTKSMLETISSEDFEEEGVAKKETHIIGFCY